MRPIAFRKLLLQIPIAAILVSGQYVIESSTFGQGDRISPNRFGIPHWHISGDGQNIPQLLTDKVVLTPPYPGNRRGAVWAETSLAQSEWIVDFEFRATGPDRGGGNLQLWYLKDGRPQVETPSIYTIGAFDGLALVIDMYGGKGGGIRGFMNDGSTDYKSHHAVDSLAFGHCDFAYRNLGRPSKLQVKQFADSFEVVVDGRRCFWSDKIKMPSGYYFGVSAASADTPDSFEIYKFVTTTAPGVTRELPRREPPPQQPPPAADPGGQTTDQGTQQASSNAQFAVQFTDLQNRLSTLSQSLDNVFREVQSLSAKSDARHQDLTHRVSHNEQLNTMDQKVQSIENTLRDYSGQFSSIHGVLKDSHSTLNEGLTQQMTHIISTKSPKIGTFVVVIIVFQLLLAGIYVMYKRRRASGPKKYL
ncbi:MAG: hypothetical protein LQ345_003441 [Seirophora villosa]|nr:MAG: hypothetical protein LQ345_003441 [Seirophora villosa]